MSRTLLVSMALCAGLWPAAWAQGPALATEPVQSAGDKASQAFDGYVEAVRQSVVAAQVPGASSCWTSRPVTR